MRALRGSLASLCFAALAVGGGAAVAQPTVTGMDLVSSVRSGRTSFEYTYRIHVQNDATPLVDVVARTTSTSPAIVVVDGEAAVGELVANANVVTADTITLRVERTVPFNPGALEWGVLGTPAVALEVTKTDSADPVREGDSFTYTITVTNRGILTARNVAVNDETPDKLFFARATAPLGFCADFVPSEDAFVSCSFDEIPPGEQRVVTIETQAVLAGTALNCVEVGAELAATAKECEPTTILAGIPILRAFFPSTVPAGRAAELVVDGRFVLPGAVLLVDGVPLGLTPFQMVGVGERYRVTVPESLLATPGQISLALRNPNGDTSNVRMLTVELPPQANLLVVKADSADPVVAGTEFHYTVTITNSGPAPATDVVLSDLRPLGLTFTRAITFDGECLLVDPGARCTFSEIPVGERREVVIGALAAEPGTYENCVEVLAQPNATVAGTCEPTTVTGRVADLEVVKSDSADPVPFGTPFSYTVTVTNHGPQSAHTVQIFDERPAGIELVSASQSALHTCRIEPPGASCELFGALEPGESFTATINAVGTALGTYTNCVRATANEHDPGGDALHCEPTTIVAVPPVLHSVLPGIVTAGNPDFELTIFASGVEAGTVVIVGATELTPSSVDPFPNGELVIHVTVPAEVIATAGLLAVTLRNPNGDMSNVLGLDVLEALMAELEVIKSDSADPVVAGTPFFYTISITNHGPSIAHDIVLLDERPAGLTFTSAVTLFGECALVDPGARCTLEAMPPGQHREVLIGALAAEPGTYENCVQVMAFPNKSPTRTCEPTTVTGRVADLEVVKSDSADPVPLGTPFSYTVTVTNHGPQSAHTVQIFDERPAGIELVSASQSALHTCRIEPPGASCELFGALEPGESFTATINAVGSAIGTHTNCVRATANEHDPGGDALYCEPTTIVALAPSIMAMSPGLVVAGTSDDFELYLVGEQFAAGSVVIFAGVELTPSSAGSNSIEATVPAGLVAEPGDKTVQVRNPDGTLSNTVFLQVTLSANLVVTKSDSADPIAAGTPFLYTVTVTNLGPDRATAVQLIDVRPPGMAFTHAVSTSGDCAVVDPGAHCTFSEIHVGETVEVLIEAHGTVEGTHTNCVEVTAERNSVATAICEPTTITGRVADLEVVKSDSADPVPLGTPFSYTVTVTNHGPQSAHTVQILDERPAGIELVSASQSSSHTCWIEPPGARCEFFGALEPGASFTATINAVGAAVGTHLNCVRATANEHDPGGAEHCEPTTIVAARADLGLSILPSAPAFVVDQGTILYEIPVTNTGPDKATGVIVTGAVSGGPAIDSATVPLGDCAVTGALGEAFQCHVDGIDTGGTRTFTIRVSPSVTGTISLTGAVTAAQEDPTPGDTQAVAETHVYPKLVLTGSPLPNGTTGQPFDYAGLSHTGGTGGPVLFSLGAAAPGFLSISSTGVITGTPPADAAGVFDVPIVLTQDGPPLQTATLVLPIEILSADATGDVTLSVTKTGPASVAIGEQVAYSIIVTNTGERTAGDVEVIDRLPKHVAAVPGSIVASAGSCFIEQSVEAGVPMSSVVCTQSALAPAQTITVQFTAAASTSAASPITNVARAVSHDPESEVFSSAPVVTSLVPRVVAVVNVLETGALENSIYLNNALIPSNKQFAISGTGRYVAFTTSDARVLVRDTCEGDAPDECVPSTARVSGADPGASGVAVNPSISADGRWVAFLSTRRGEDPVNQTPIGRPQFYVRDTCAGALGCTPRTLVIPERIDDVPDFARGVTSVAPVGPVISANGRYVVFSVSTDNGLTPDLDRNQIAILVHDRDPDGNGAFDETGTTSSRVVSYLPDGTLFDGNNFPTEAAISGDGRRIAFVSTGTAGGRPRIFLRAVPEQQTIELSRLTDPQASLGIDLRADLSFAGDYVAYVSASPSPGLEHVFRMTTCGPGSGSCTSDAELVTRTPEGAPITFGPAGGFQPPSVSASGRFIAFAHLSDELSDESDFAFDAFVWDSCLGAAAPCTPSLRNLTGMLPNGQQSPGGSVAPRLSANAQYMVFISDDTFLPGVPPGQQVLYLARTALTEDAQ